MPGEALPQPRHQPASPSGKAEDEFGFGQTATSTSKSFAASTGTAVGLYATPSYASLYVEPEDLEPGPGSYDVGGKFGHQLLSTIRSEPSLSMTARHDKSWNKVMITKDHLSSLMARETPGPGTYMPMQTMSQSRVRFGTAKRRGIADDTFKAPGPVYDTEVATGDHQKVKVKFGKASRWRESGHQADQPGPGDYPRRVLMVSKETGKAKEIGMDGRVPAEGTSGFNASRMAKSFGASHRAYDRVWFPGSERAAFGRLSPGPGSASAFHNSGKAQTFGNAPRMPPNTAAKRAPGPGAYDSHERETAVTESSPKFGMGRPNARGRLNLKQMKLLTHTSSWGVTA